MSRVSRGLFWSAVDQFSVQGVQFVLSILIARLVSPEAYGVVVLVQVFMAFAQVFIDGGLKSALIQKKDRTDTDFYTAFLFNFALSVFLYIVLYFAAPFISDFYNQPQLISLTRVVSLNLIFSSLSITQLVRIQVALDFKIQAKARLISVILSGFVGIICAYNGMEAWALVIQSVFSTFLTTIFLMFFSRWLPKFIFSIKSFKNLFGYGSKLLFNNLLTTFYLQITNLVIGKFYLPAQLAYYNRAFSISQLPSTSLMESIGRTIYPIYCELQDNRDELIRAYRKYLRLSTLAIFPIMALLCSLSYPLISVLLTDKWLPAAPLLSLFCIGFSNYIFQYNASNILTATGFAWKLVKINIVLKIIDFTLLIIALTISVQAVAIVFVINNFIYTTVLLLTVKRSLHIDLMEQIGFVKDLVLDSIFFGLVAWGITFLFKNSFVQLILGGTIGLVLLLLLFNIQKIDELSYIRDFINKVKTILWKEKR